MSGISLSRRRFLQASGATAGALVVGFHVPGRFARAAGGAGQFAPNAFVRVAPDGIVTVIVNKSEMGQGVYTSLPMLIAEELDADWSQIRVEAAPADPAYKHSVWGVQVTGGSSSIPSSWQQFRQAGAAARAMLLEAAGRTWEVPAAELQTRDGHVAHAGSARRVAPKWCRILRRIGRRTARLSEGRCRTTRTSLQRSTQPARPTRGAPFSRAGAAVPGDGITRP